MAKVKFTAAIDAIDGSINQTTFSKTRQGYILKQKPIPRKEILNKRSRVNSAMGIVGTTWREILTDDQIKLWINAAKLYNDKISAYNYFMLVNLRLAIGGVGLETGPPPKPTITLPTPTQVTTQKTTFNSEIDLDISVSQQILIYIYLTPMQPRSVRYYESKFVYAGVVLSNANTQKVNITSVVKDFFTKTRTEPITYNFAIKMELVSTQRYLYNTVQKVPIVT